MKKRRFGWGVATGVVITLVLPIALLASGLIDVGATNEPGALERNLAALAVNSSLAWRAPEKENPFDGDPSAIDRGLSHYAGMCVRCHGGPGVEREEFAKGLNPPAPPLDHAAEEFTAGELFWITKHGLRMTAMPAFGLTHKDEDIWRIVAVVQALPDLSSERQQELARVVSDSRGHGTGSHPAGDDGGQSSSPR